MIAQKWTVSGISAETGLDRRTVAKILGPVDPCEKSGRTKKYWLKDFIQAMRTGQTGNLEDERIRLTRAQANNEELRLAANRKELIPAQEVEAEWVGMVATARALLLALPSKVANKAMMVSGVKEIEALVKKEIYSVLTELSNGSAAGNTEKGAGDMGTTTDPDDKRMGGPRAATKPGGKRRARPVAQ